ncbi:MAG: leucine-rich repeat domain-containing protein [Huintestinicola sp.]
MPKKKKSGPKPAPKKTEINGETAVKAYAHGNTRKKSMRMRIFVVAVVVVFLLGIIIIPLQSFAADENDSVVVSSFETGKLADALLEAANGTDYNYIKKAAVLSGTLAEEDYAALLNIPNLEYIELAGAQTKDGVIPENAIPSRNQLVYISLPSNTVEIGAGAFSNNKKLEKISMPSSVQIIGDRAFEACEALTGFPVNSGITYIGESAFRDCKAFTEFSIPAGITEIYPYTFSKCGFEEIILGPDIKSIGDGAFSDCNNLKDIYSYAKEAPSISGAGVFQNVSASIHVYDGSEESYAAWEGNNIKAVGDLAGEYTAPAIPEGTVTEAAKPQEETTAETEAEEAKETEVSAAEESTAAETEASEPAQAASAQNSGGLSVGVVIVIVAMAMVIAVLATILVMTKKNGGKK